MSLLPLTVSTKMDRNKVLDLNEHEHEAAATALVDDNINTQQTSKQFSTVQQC